MKAIYQLLFITTILFMLGCESQHTREESTLIDSYLGNIKLILQAHAKGMANSAGMASNIEQHKISIKNLENLKVKFAEYKDFKELQAYVETVNFAISRLYIRNQQIYALASPIWQGGQEKFYKIKDPDYYQHHQGMLSELIAMMDEFTNILREHKDDVRKTMLRSGLSKERRLELWPSLNSFLSQHIATFIPQTYVIRQMVAGQIELADFLFEQRENYYFSPEEQRVIFRNNLLAQQYNNKLKFIQQDRYLAEMRAKQGY